jgi:hypothetical protein
MGTASIQMVGRFLIDCTALQCIVCRHEYAIHKCCLALSRTNCHCQPRLSVECRWSETLVPHERTGVFPSGASELQWRQPLCWSMEGRFLQQLVVHPPPLVCPSGCCTERHFCYIHCRRLTDTCYCLWRCNIEAYMYMLVCVCVYVCVYICYGLWRASQQKQRATTCDSFTCQSVVPLACEDTRPASAQSVLQL